MDLKIKSNFIDYYDSICTNNSIIEYNRVGKGYTKGEQLKIVSKLGIPVIELKSASQFAGEANKLIVYTDTTKHNKKGKKIVSIEEAMLMYNNNLASKFYAEANNKTTKFLQVGKRRFSIEFESDEESLQEGRITSIRELSSAYNYVIVEPIFSIDYICINNVLTAIDYNDIQRLADLNFERIMSKEEVTNEICRALIEYNKVNI